MKNIWAIVLLLLFIHGICVDDWHQFGSAIMLLVLTPPSYDPAIRIKEWQIEKSRQSESER